MNIPFVGQRCGDIGRLLHRDRLEAPAPQGIECAALRHRRQPGRGTLRNSLGRPYQQRALERVLKRVFGEGEIAELTNQTRDHPGPFALAHALDSAGGHQYRRALRRLDVNA